MSPRLPFDPSELSRHTEFLRRLVWDLVRDEDRVDDVIQETWLTAMTRRPKRGASSRSWLGGIARNLALRSAAKELRRERLRDGLAEPDLATEASRQIDELRGVTDALAVLDERYQSVLVLRYLHDLPPREIARETGLPLATVKTRLKRGLARLRERLDARSGGDRQVWVTGLLPLVRRGCPVGSAVALSTGALIVKTKIAALAAVVVLVGAFFAWQTWSESPSPTPPLKRSARTEEATSREAASRPVTPIETESFTPEPVTEVVAALPAGHWGLRGVVRWRDGGAVPGAQLEFRPQGSEAPLKATADAEGAYALPLGETGALRYVAVVALGTRLILSVGWPEELKAGKPRWVDWDLTIPGPSVVRGRVLDTRQNPVRGIGLKVRSTAKEYPETSRLFLTRPDGSFEIRVPFEGQCLLDLWPRLDPAGSAADTADYRRLRAATLTKEGLPEGKHRLTYRTRSRGGAEALELWPMGAGKEELNSPNRVAGKEVVLGPDRIADVGTLLVGACGRLDFKLVDPKGEPLEGIWLKALCPVRGASLATLASDASGRTSLEYLPGRRVVWITVDDWHLADREQRLNGVPVNVPPGGVANVELKLTKEVWPLSMKAKSVSFSVVDSYRSPIAGARVTWLGREGVTDARGRVSLGAATEEKGVLVIEAEGYKRKETPDYTPHPMWTTFVLEADRLATLVVRDAEGRPVPTLNILKAQSQSDGQGGRLESIFDGAFDRRSETGRHAIPPLQPGARMSVLVLWSRDAGIARLDVSQGLPPGTERPVVLRPVTLVRGRLHDARGDAVAGARILSGAPDFPVSLERLRGNRSGMGLAGRHCVGDATSAADGSFEVLAPSTNGILCVLARDGTAMVRPYAAAAELERLTVPDPLRLSLRGTRAPESDQEVYLSLVHPVIQFNLRHAWPKGTDSVEIPVPVRGRWETRLLPKLLPSGTWGGLHGQTTLDLQGDRAEATLAVKPYGRK